MSASFYDNSRGGRRSDDVGDTMFDVAAFTKLIPGVPRRHVGESVKSGTMADAICTRHNYH